MPDWKHEIRQGLASVKLAPTHEAAIIKELAQYLDDHYAALLAGGVTEAEAYRQTLAELDGSELLANELHRAERQIKQEPIVFGYDRRTDMEETQQVGQPEPIVLPTTPRNISSLNGRIFPVGRQNLPNTPQPVGKIELTLDLRIIQIDTSETKGAECSSQRTCRDVKRL